MLPSLARPHCMLAVILGRSSFLHCEAVTGFGTQRLGLVVATQFYCVVSLGDSVSSSINLRVGSFSFFPPLRFAWKSCSLTLCLLLM